MATLIELALGDPAGNEEPTEEQGETQGVDEYHNLAIIPAGGGEQVTPAEAEKPTGEAQMLVYRRRSRRSDRREVEHPSMIEELEMPAAPGDEEIQEEEEDTTVPEEQEAEEEAEVEVIEISAEEQGVENETVIELSEEVAEEVMEREQPDELMEEGQQEIGGDDTAPVGEEIGIGAAEVAPEEVEGDGAGGPPNPRPQT